MRKLGACDLVLRQIMKEYHLSLSAFLSNPSNNRIGIRNKFPRPLAKTDFVWTFGNGKAPISVVWVSLYRDIQITQTEIDKIGSLGVFGWIKDNFRFRKLFLKPLIQFFCSFHTSSSKKLYRAHIVTNVAGNKKWLRNSQPRRVSFPTGRANPLDNGTSNLNPIA